MFFGFSRGLFSGLLTIFVGFYFGLSDRNSPAWRSPCVERQKWRLGQAFLSSKIASLHQGDVYLASRAKIESNQDSTAQNLSGKRSPKIWNPVDYEPSQRSGIQSIKKIPEKLLGAHEPPDIRYLKCFDKGTDTCVHSFSGSISSARLLHTLALTRSLRLPRMSYTLSDTEFRGPESSRNLYEASDASRARERCGPWRE